MVYDFDKKNVRHSLGYTIVPLAKIDVVNGTVQCQELDDCPQVNIPIISINVALILKMQKWSIKISHPFVVMACTV